MTRRFLRRSVLVLAGIGAAATVLAAPLQADPNGPTAFYFTATCTGLGPVLLVNAGPAHADALQVVGTTTIVLTPVNESPGVAKRADAAGTTCTITGFGPSPDEIEPVDNPQPQPAVIVRG